MSWRDRLYRDRDGLGRRSWGGSAALAFEAASVAVCTDLILRERALGWTVGNPKPFALQHLASTAMILLLASILAAISASSSIRGVFGPSSLWLSGCLSSS